MNPGRQADHAFSLPSRLSEGSAGVEVPDLIAGVELKLAGSGVEPIVVLVGVLVGVLVVVLVGVWNCCDSCLGGLPPKSS